MLTASNPYLSHIHQVLPRRLSLFDEDATSSSCGMWGTGTTGRGGSSTSATPPCRVQHTDWCACGKTVLCPYPTTPHLFLRRIDRMFDATAALTRRHGSLKEAFQNEGSYCVTALVAYDLLCARLFLQQQSV